MALSPVRLPFARSSCLAFSSAPAPAASTAPAGGSASLVMPSVRRLLRLSRFLDRHPALLVLSAHLELDEERYPAAQHFFAALEPLRSPSAGGVSASGLPPPRPPHSPLPPELAPRRRPRSQETDSSPSVESPVLRFFRREAASRKALVSSPRHETQTVSSMSLSASTPVPGPSVTQLVCSYLRRSGGNENRREKRGCERLHPEDLEGSLVFIWEVSRLCSRLQFSAYECTRKLHAPLCLLLPPDARWSQLASLQSSSTPPEQRSCSSSPCDARLPVTAAESSEEATAARFQIRSPCLPAASPTASPADGLTAEDVRAAHALEESLVRLLSLARDSRAGTAVATAAASPRAGATARACLREADADDPRPTAAQLDEAVDALLLPPHRWTVDDRARFAATLHPLRLTKRVARPRRKACEGVRERGQSKPLAQEFARVEEPATAGKREPANDWTEAKSDCETGATESGLSTGAEMCADDGNGAAARETPESREETERYPSALEAKTPAEVRRPQAEKDSESAHRRPSAEPTAATALRRGLLLLSNPLTCDMWERAVVLITHVSRRGCVDGVILNKRRAWRPLAWSSAASEASALRGNDESSACTHSRARAFDASRLPEVSSVGAGKDAPSRRARCALLPDGAVLPTSYSSFVAHWPRQLRLLQYARNNLETALTLSSPSSLPSPTSSSLSSSPTSSSPSSLCSPSSLSSSGRASGLLGEALLSRASVALEFHVNEACKAKEETAETLSRVMEEMATDLLDAVDFPPSSSASFLAAAHASELRSEAPYLVRLLNWYRLREEREKGVLSESSRAFSLASGVPSHPDAAEHSTRAAGGSPLSSLGTRAPAASAPFLAVTPVSVGDAGKGGDADEESAVRGDGGSVIVSFLASLPYGAISPAQAAAAAQKVRRDAALARFLPPQTGPHKAPAKPEKKTPKYKPTHAEAGHPGEAGGPTACAPAAREGGSGGEGEDGGAKEGQEKSAEEVSETLEEGRGQWRETGGRGELGGDGSREGGRETDACRLLERYSFGGPVPGLTVLHSTAERGLVEVFPNGVFLGTRRPRRGKSTPSAGASEEGDVASADQTDPGEKTCDLGVKKGEHGTSKDEQEADPETGVCRAFSPSACLSSLGCEADFSVAAGEVKEAFDGPTRPVEAAPAAEAEDSPLSRTFLGKAAWSPGQLEREIGEGAWILVGCTDSGVMQELVFGDELTARRRRSPGALEAPQRDENELWSRVLSALAASPSSGSHAGLYEAMSRFPLCLARDTGVVDGRESDDDTD
ncbi:conserved hypothetical protein [Neospora caninum Liverpool]|nr:conserved hypothetical protein [Neospora caninum Liverpool]CBZ49529.1 conserved hypothetical protein [Neospora caninum Liverpool]|eukprot:XP_003879564.1 conserved hypothetical protein [Neospora caninum Liverpool]